MEREQLKVLVACETSGTVRDAFFWEGFDAWSCDILPSDTPTNRHLQGNVLDVIGWDEWDLVMVGHPPCTRLCNSGVRWLHKPPAGKTVEEMWQDLDKGAGIFRALMDADVPMIAIENPVMHKHAKQKIWGAGWEKLCKDDGTFTRTTVQPWHFAQSDDAEDNLKKMTHLWLKNLPALKRTGRVDGSTARDDIHMAPPGEERWKIRSKFHNGIAQAMAEQWGNAALRFKQSQTQSIAA